MNFPKVSIQIPTYNQQGFIKKTVESCLMQDYPNLEINIADDNSTDDTYTLIKPYLKDERLRYYKNGMNVGRVANYRKALYEYATGEWAINLDGDDYFTDSAFISKAVDIIGSLANENIVVYQANHDIAKLKELFPAGVQADEETILLNGQDYFVNYYKVNHFFHCATMYKRKEALQLDFYSYDCLHSDFNSVAKLFLTGNLLLSSKKVAVWNSHEANASATLNGKSLQVELDAMQQLADFSGRFLPVKPVKKWHRMMKGYLLSRYLDRQTTVIAKRSALKHLLLHFSFDKVHFRQLVKAILGSTGFR